jgi:hypothetical protein
MLCIRWCHRERLSISASGGVWPILLASTVSDSFRSKPLSFHAVSFGEDASAGCLRRMANLALEIQNNAPRHVLLPDTVNVPSSFATALDTVSTTYATD